MGGQKVEAVERALAILGAFAAGKPSLTLAELAQATLEKMVDKIESYLQDVLR